MSANLKWRPDVPPEGEYLSDDFRFAIRQGHDFNDGEVTLRRESAGYLRGMAAAGNDAIRKDCTTLLEALEHHESLLLWLEY